MSDFCFQSRYYLNEEIDPKFEKRANLVKEIFLIEEYGIVTAHLHYFYSRSSMLNIEYTLYLKLLFSIFHINLTTGKIIKEIFLELHEQWENFLINEKFPVSFIIALPNIIVKDDIEVIENLIYIKKPTSIEFVSPNNSISWYPTLLFYRRDISGKLYKTIKDQNKNLRYYQHRFKEEFELIKFELQEIVATLYVHDIDFNYNPFFTQLPWWFELNFEEFEKLKMDSYKKKYNFSINNIKESFEILPKLIQSRYFRDETYVNLYHNYIQLYNRDFIPDIIKDIFILFEFFFIRESSEDISLQFAFNCSLFISDNAEDFIENFRFLKKSYKVRSSLVHGEEWQDYFQALIQHESNIQDKFDLIKKWREILNMALRKLIEAKSENYDILHDINQLEKEENVKKKINFQLKLVNYYLSKSEYSYALKLLYNSLELSANISDSSLINEIKSKIKTIHEKREDVIVYHKELRDIQNELEIIEILDIEKSLKAKELNEKIIKFGLKKRLESDKILLEVNGNDIMEILNIPESKRVGEIKKLLIEKVVSTVLNNERNEIIDFLKNNRQELLD